METFLVMIDIVTLQKELRVYYLLKSRNIKNAQAIIDTYIRNKGATERGYDCSMTMVEKIDKADILTLERYIDYFK